MRIRAGNDEYRRFDLTMSDQFDSELVGRKWNQGRADRERNKKEARSYRKSQRILDT